MDKLSLSIDNSNHSEDLGLKIMSLFKSQFILAEHECSTNWGDCKPSKSNQIIKSNKSNISNQIKLNKMLVFEERGKPEYPEKNLLEQSREPTNSVHI